MDGSEKQQTSRTLAADVAEGPVASQQGRRGRRARRVLFQGTLMLLGPVALLAAGAYYYIVSARYVSTDNAYVKAEKIVVSTDLSERVVEVAVRDNEVVKPGQMLFRLDDRPYQIALQRAEAQLKRAMQDIDVRRATYRQKGAELKLVEGDIDYYRTISDRQDQLSNKGIISQSKFDEARRDFRNAQQKAQGIRQEIEQVVASLGGNPDAPKEKHPEVLQAMAAVDQAGLDLRRTSVFAPVAGIVSHMDLQVGEHVRAGAPIFSMVRIGYVWVEANLKETDLTHVRVGQKAKIRIDTYPERDWTATVESISPATGAEFALLPPQNASGNWVKVVQRLPVRLAIATGPNDPPLRAGMSVVVEVDTGHERVLPSIVTTALAWIKGGS
ncbi:MAG: HlyD family secretion protein [Rhodospirillales bacterium]|nr:HlyD family secretion protein [Rhodospirillales bacterium]